VTACQLTDLEFSVMSYGWTVIAEDYTDTDSRRRGNRRSTVVVAVCSPEGETYAGESATRGEALRIAAELAGLAPGGPRTYQRSPRSASESLALA